MHKMLPRDLKLFNCNQSFAVEVKSWVDKITARLEVEKPQEFKLPPSALEGVQSRFKMSLIYLQCDTEEKTMNYFFKKGSVILCLRLSLSLDNLTDLRVTSFLYPLYANNKYSVSLREFIPFDEFTFDELKKKNSFKDISDLEFKMVLKNAGWLFNEHISKYERPSFLSI